MVAREQTRAIVYHCSATRPNLDIGAREIREWHIARGWADIGYHIVIRRDGTIEWGRHPAAIGAHVAGHNTDSIGVCLVGGLDDHGVGHAHRPDLFTPAQWHTALDVARVLRAAYPRAQILGHRDLSPDANGDGKIAPTEWLKTCPGFDVKREIIDRLLESA